LIRRFTLNEYRDEAARNPTFYLDVNNKALALLITAEKALRKSSKKRSKEICQRDARRRWVAKPENRQRKSKRNVPRNL